MNYNIVFFSQIGPKKISQISIQRMQCIQFSRSYSAYYASKAIAWINGKPNRIVVYSSIFKRFTHKVK